MRRRFQHLFDNEAVLQSVLVQLLRRIPGIEGVQLTHGTQELGKDIVFGDSDLDGLRISSAIAMESVFTAAK